MLRQFFNILVVSCNTLTALVNCDVTQIIVYSPFVSSPWIANRFA